jgi:hypothetical protein
MRYLCLIYDDERMVDAMSPEERQARHLGYADATREMREAGQLVAGEALQPVAAAATVRVRNGRLSATDGPFAETKEQLGGFYLIEARDRDEAVALAARLPSARTGSIEVRPVVDFSQAA